jgi:hypothetical protein
VPDVPDCLVRVVQPALLLGGAEAVEAPVVDQREVTDVLVDVQLAVVGDLGLGLAGPAVRDQRLFLRHPFVGPGDRVVGVSRVRQQHVEQRRMPALVGVVVGARELAVDDVADALRRGLVGGERRGEARALCRVQIDARMRRRNRPAAAVGASTDPPARPACPILTLLFSDPSISFFDMLRIVRCKRAGASSTRPPVSLRARDL